MFNRSVKRIVLVVMSALFLLLIGTLSLIYIVSYNQLTNDYKRSLENYSRSYDIELIQREEEFPSFNPINPDGRDNRKSFFEMPLTTVFSVLYSEDGDVLRIDNKIERLYSNDKITDIAKSILESGKKSGYKQSLFYLVEAKGENTLVCFIDGSITNNSFREIIIVTLIFGGVALSVGLVLSIILAKRIVKPLEENDKRQKRFISDAGHELKTPISIISANSEILARSIGNNEWLNNIQYENERMQKLVTELLDLSRAENSNLEKTNVDFSNLIMGEILPFESLAFEKGKIINSQIDDSIYIKGNESELKKLISILLDNAIKHSSDNSNILVSLTKEHKLVTLSIQNDGEDIPEEKIEKLFDRFYRVDEARSGEGSHYGLGLAIAKTIVLGHNGKITCTSSDGLITFTVIFEENK